MPFFNYSCEECGQTVEDKLVKKHDQEVICPVCNHVMTKQISGCSFSVPYGSQDWQSK